MLQLVELYKYNYLVQIWLRVLSTSSRPTVAVSFRSNETFYRISQSCIAYSLTLITLAMGVEGCRGGLNRNPKQKDLEVALSYIDWIIRHDKKDKCHPSEDWYYFSSIFKVMPCVCNCPLYNVHRIWALQVLGHVPTSTPTGNHLKSFMHEFVDSVLTWPCAGWVFVQNHTYRLRLPSTHITSFSSLVHYVISSVTFASVCSACLLLT